MHSSSVSMHSLHKAIPGQNYSCSKLVKIDDDAKKNQYVELQYRHTLENLGKLGNCSCVALDNCSCIVLPSLIPELVTTYIPVGGGGMLGTILRKMYLSVYSLKFNLANLPEKTWT